MRFSPSTAVNRYVALRRWDRPATPSPSLSASHQSSFDSAQSSFDSAQSHPTKRQKHGQTDDPVSKSSSSDVVRQQASMHTQGVKQHGIQNHVQRQNLVDAEPGGHSSTMHVSEASSPVVARPYDPLPVPSQEIHRYIVSTRLLQNTAIVRALLDPECGRSQLVERDVDYLRVNAIVRQRK